ncbi:MAG: hypothetical protein G01um101418_163 [Parcubacteria group bacterium Gr01-1014_18]|nr:MAG: hypothetical protein Greene041636_131 [Parcubacteria group bacterium Greene0416_36]TSC81323.1 MAG: hypothetical protein G01um101418_163 [Parcubacteria group bacterium Gr01-1014_18]TSC99491.1 MAG: hypothetical protein Greene101420_158 [Parcubacteria group bacterium Greene1014_20]TSD07590.1 MAG: hypothetical protein Greene07142_47 [Parcubacteria group bacterium Greene0714_2]
MYERTKSIPYPYKPEDIEFEFINADHSWLLEAKAYAEKCAGCCKQKVGGVLIRDEQIIACGANGAEKGIVQGAVCKRVVAGCKSGEGYTEYCPQCDVEGHCEAMTIKNALANKIPTIGAVFVMWNHWWCCEACCEVLRKAGITKVLMEKDIHKKFVKA